MMIGGKEKAKLNEALVIKKSLISKTLNI